ncbi:ATP-binding protein [Haloferula sargassicola]|uniref:histidine kinase n=1 Tax=Haloferula sargassicola TaxID=490096 RepID=A0ABP9UK80_9BACT
MNPLLHRQLRKIDGTAAAEDPALREFLDLVGETYDEFDAHQRLLSHTLEITSEELTEANERLRHESESRLRSISRLFEETLNQQPNIIFRTRKEEGRFVVSLARGRLLARLGWDHSALEKDTIGLLIDDPRHAVHFHQAWGGEEQNFEVDFWHVGIVCEVLLHPIWENGEVTEIVGIVTDISRQKAAEDRLRHATEDTARRAAELESNRRVMLSMIEDLDQSHHKISRERDRANALAEEAASANRAKSDFLATMSHEIRTPMNGVLGFAQLLQQTPLSEQQEDFVTAIRTSAEALLRVINDVLDFSKIESGHMEIEEHPFSLQTCVDEALGTVSTAAAEKGIDLAARLDAGVPPSISGDSHRLRQVLVNLLGNAVKFTPEGEVRLEVEAGPTDDAGRVELRFRVSDTGVGIDPGQIERLFHPFHQQDSSTSRRFGGTGLGLAICRRLVELMGGGISVESRHGSGSTFTFTLPVTVSENPPPLVRPMPYPDFDGRRVLVVDGHRWSLRVITELLERWGMDVRPAASTEEARAELDGWVPQTALIDQAEATTPAGEQFVHDLAAAGAAPLLLCGPGDLLTPRDHFRDAIGGTLSKPLKVSPLFNMLLKQAARFRDPAVARPAQAPEPAAEQCSLRLLLAEDNAINRKLALAALAQLGCTPDIAVDGGEAIAAATTRRYDVILMDVQMPGMDGLEATRHIRAWESEHALPATRIIALTANALSGDRDLCLKAGMDDYLPKPIRLHSLREMLRPAATADEPAPIERPEAPATRALRQLAVELTAADAVSLATEFIDDLPGQLDEVREAVRLNNDADARRHAHSLKGSASIFSLEVLRHAAAAVEESCAARRLEEAGRRLETLEQAARTATEDLHDALHALGVNTVISPMS